MNKIITYLLLISLTTNLGCQKDNSAINKGGEANDPPPSIETVELKQGFLNYQLGATIKDTTHLIPLVLSTDCGSCKSYRLDDSEIARVNSKIELGCQQIVIQTYKNLTSNIMVFTNAKSYVPLKNFIEKQFNQKTIDLEGSLGTIPYHNKKALAIIRRGKLSSGGTIYGIIYLDVQISDLQKNEKQY